jgi:tetratricopeptide (TPR) repeat protein
MKRSAIIVSVLAAVLLSAGGTDVHAQGEEKISAKVAKPMKAAQEAIQKKQWDQALAKTLEAQTTQGRTAFDDYQINEFLGYIYLQQRKYGDAARVYEQQIASGRVPADQLAERLKTLVQLFTVSKTYPKVTDYGSRWIKGGGSDIDTRVLVGQAYYLQKDYKNAIAVIEGLTRDAEKAGKPVQENWLQLVRSSYTNLGNAEGANRTLEQLVRLYPKPEYWDALLDGLIRQKSTDRVALNVYRLMLEVGVLQQPDEYVEMAEMLLEEGLPGEAQRVMEAGYAAKVFDTDDKVRADRYARRLADAKATAEADRKTLSAAAVEAQKATTGQPDVALGLAYASFQDYAKAAEAIPRGLQKGGVTDPDQAQIILGIANLKLGKKPEAMKAFEQVKAADPQLNEVARLWTIYTKSSG